MKFSKTDRGFGLVEHPTHANEPQMKSLVQESSAIGDYEHSYDEPGSSYLWVGADHHLDREQVRMLIKVMEWWLKNRRLPVLAPEKPIELDQRLTKQEADWAADYHDNQDTTTLMLRLYEQDLLRDELTRLENHLELPRYSLHFSSLRRATMAAINMREFGIDVYEGVDDE